MLIALSTETYPPEVNGVAMTLHRLVNGLVAHDHRVQLIRPRPASARPGATSSGCQDLLVPGMRLPFYPSLQMGLPCRKRLLHAWKKDRPDLVHIATEGPLGWSALMAARHLGIPTVSSYHTNFHQYGRHYGLGLLRHAALAYLRTFHNLTRTTFVPTRLLKAQLGESGFRNLELLGRGVDTTLFSPERRDPQLRRLWQVQANDLVCLYVGRLAAEKNLPLAVEAFLRIRVQQPSARFALVGDGPIGTRLAQRHPEFIFTGYQRGEILAAHYASADLFIFPSLTETFGNVITEAMASGLPVVAFRNGAAAQHLSHGESALLAPMDDARSFVESAALAGTDPELRRRLGQSARRIARRLGWTEIIDSYLGQLLRMRQSSRRIAATAPPDLASLQRSLSAPSIKWK